MIGVIDYNAGNLGSLCNAIKSLGFDFILLNSTEQIRCVDKVIMPGQGRAGMMKKGLSSLDLLRAIKNLNKPFLGICLGMQLLYENLAEDEVTGLSLVSGSVQKFQTSLPIPQIGWNQIQLTKSSPLFREIPEKSFLYFANSYFASANPEQDLAQYDYGIIAAAAIQKGNFFGVQFHPEKSGEVGKKILKNFIELC